MTTIGLVIIGLGLLIVAAAFWRHAIAEYITTRAQRRH